LVTAGRYKKEKRDELISIIWDWVKAPSVEDLDERRGKLLEALHSEEAVYIQSYYRPKEYQFCRAYTQTYLNLGVHSTQRNESYHNVVKARLNKNMPISKAIQVIVEQTKELGRLYDAEINHQRRTIPRILDEAAFTSIKRKVTRYALDLAIREWSATRKWQTISKTERRISSSLTPRRGAPLAANYQQDTAYLASIGCITA
jgi:hypothetical protein